jgi:ADP-ribose diphosphatase
VVPWRLSELPQLLARNDCSEARSIAALFMTREYLADA